MSKYVNLLETTALGLILHTISIIGKIVQNYYNVFLCVFWCRIVLQLDNHFGFDWLYIYLPELYQKSVKCKVTKTTSLACMGISFDALPVRMADSLNQIKYLFPMQLGAKNACFCTHSSVFAFIFCWKTEASKHGFPCQCRAHKVHASPHR